MKDDFNNAARSEFCDLPNLSAEIDGNDELEKYQSMLPDTGLSKDQELQALQALKFIIFNIVLLSFNTHPTQEACGQREESSPELCIDGASKVESQESENDKLPTDSAQ